MPSNTFTAHLFRRIALPFLLATIVLVAFIAHLSLARATITLEIGTQATEVESQFTISGTATPTQDIIDGKIVTLTLSEEQNAEAKNTSLEKGIAEGKTTILNDGSTSQILVKTTRLLSPEGILFRLKNRVTVPARGEIETEVYADVEGPEGNIPPTKFTIPGLSEARQKIVYAQSKENMTGGLRELKKITRTDIDNAKVNLQQSLEEKLKNKLQNQIKPPLYYWPSATEFKILSFETLATEGDKTENLAVIMELEATTAVANQEDVRQFLTHELKQKIPTGYTIDLGDSLNNNIVLHLESLNTEDKSAKIKAKVSVPVIPSLDPQTDFDKSSLRGLDKEETIAFFNALIEAKNVEVKFSPFWVKTVPRLQDHVEIIIRE